MRHWAVIGAAVLVAALALVAIVYELMLSLALGMLFLMALAMWM